MTLTKLLARVYFVNENFGSGEVMTVKTMTLRDAPISEPCGINER